MAKLFLSRPLQKGEMKKIMRGLSKRQQELVRFWLDVDDQRDKNPQIRISSNSRTIVAAVKAQLDQIKGVRIL